MKCHEPTCTIPHTAEYVKLETSEQSCAAHLPDGPDIRAFLEGELETYEGWTHVDGAWRCDSCCIYYSDDEKHPTCSRCHEPTCHDCLNYSEVCRNCCAKLANRSADYESCRSQSGRK